MSQTNVASGRPSSSTAGATVDELCAHLQRSRPEESTPLCEFARIFFAKVPRPLLQERSVDQLAALAGGAFDFLRRSRPDQVNVEVVNPEDEGWEAQVTVLRAELGDRPFIVDTIREYLAAENIAVHHYIYPVFGVERDAEGRLLSVGRESSGELEALVYCEIPRIPEAARRQEIAAEVSRRLADVVEATTDFPEMVEALDRTIAEVVEYRRRFPDRADEFQEVVELLEWLREENFVFLGFRAYQIVDRGEGEALVVEPGSGRGILREEGRSAYRAPVALASLPVEFRSRISGGPLLVVSKANAESTVHRRGRMDYVGIKRLDESGRVAGEWRFLGLFTSQAYAQSPAEIPILRRKQNRLLELSGTRPGSHDYKEIISILNSMPKEELFQASTEELGLQVDTVLAQLFSDDVTVSLRRDPLRGGVGVMVILPRGRFSGEARQRILELLLRRFGGPLLSYHLAMTGGEQARLHFYLAAPDGAEVGAEALQEEIVQLVRSWEERLGEGLLARLGGEEGERLARLFAPAFSDEYRAANTAAAGVDDVLHLDAMVQADRGEAVHLRTHLGAASGGVPGTTVLKLYLRDQRLVLSDFMPILEDAGVRVVEVDTFAVAGPGLPHFMIYSFAVQTREGLPIPEERFTILAESLLAARNGDAPKDPFNALVLEAGLRWREVDVIRTYANFASQIGAVPSRLAPVRALTAHPLIARLLMDLFCARFDPARAAGDSSAADLHGRLLESLEGVTSLADDRALRRLMNLIEGTVRTNYFRHGGSAPTGRSGGVPYISIKVRSADVDELRKSRLLYEIYVHSSRMEGVHLRGASVSRGGIRWSDRPDDFRTEILGLVQTQVVKNATIVPSGSKGGFITKRVCADRDAQMAEAAEQYRTLMRGMLDITDNLVDGRIAPPEGVVRHDGDDPYLVVAADKGTAHLSDVANGVAAEYDFWLGDAFASGGSQGYDHKEEGITARGGWECVKRHFREMGKDIQKEPFTVVGIGDMSGDVFGNGMLLSRKIRLLAAFDHRHIFLDPNPEPETSFVERERIFALPRSSWEDYDRTLLSAGGMIVPRASKEVEITPQVRQALGIAEEVERLDGEALIRALLSAPAELLWNGGIGTYVKDREETHADAGDTTNDPVRINAEALRCKVVGEGGNLGFTQRGRIVFALAGGRINTDALDNSAGVDMSDHEVNLKILLNRVVTDGAMTVDERNTLLASMTDEVSRLVLRNNVGQSLAVSLDERRSQEALDDFAALIVALERDGRVNRVAEGIPDAETMKERALGGRGLTRPTLSVLLAHAKLYGKSHLLASNLPDDPATVSFLTGYFPAAAVEAAGLDRLAEHRLRREIVTTELVNDLVNLMGASFLHRMARDTGRGIPDVVRAWLIASRISGAAEIRNDLEGLEGKYPSETVYRWLGGLARVLERTTLWLLGNVAPETPAEALIADARAGLSTLRGGFARIVSGEDRALFLARLGELQDMGVERTLAERLITLRFLPQLMEIVHISRGGNTEEMPTAQAFYAVSERFNTAWLREALRTSAGDDPWERRYAQALSEDVARAQRSITAGLLGTAADVGLPAALDEFGRGRERQVQGFHELLAELRSDSGTPLAGYALAVRVLQGVADRAA